MTQQFDFTPQNATEVVKTGKTYLLYCPPGMGKTSTLKNLPGKTLVLDVDRTSHVLKGNPNIDIIYVDNQNTWDYWENLLLHLETIKGKYENIAIDNVSELERCLLSSLGAKGKNKGVPSQGDYQYMQFRVVNSFRWMKNLAERIVFTAWETTDSYMSAEGQQYNRSYPQINLKILNNVLGLCDVVGRLMINPEGERGYVLQGTNSIYAKNQLDDRAGCKQLEVFGEPSTIEEEPRKFKRDAYYYHPESESFVEFKKGDEVPDDADFKLCTPVTKEEYEKGIEKQKQNTQQNGEDK